MQTDIFKHTNFVNSFPGGFLESHACAAPIDFDISADETAFHGNTALYVPTDTSIAGTQFSTRSIGGILLFTKRTPSRA